MNILITPIGIPAIATNVAKEATASLGMPGVPKKRTAYASKAVLNLYFFRIYF